MNQTHTQTALATVVALLLCQRPETVKSGCKLCDWALQYRRNSIESLIAMKIIDGELATIKPLRPNDLYNPHSLLRFGNT